MGFQKIWRIFCDVCGENDYQPDNKKNSIQYWRENSGWVISGNKVKCLECAKECIRELE